jgi:hypothetical protein
MKTICWLRKLTNYIRNGERERKSSKLKVKNFVNSFTCKECEEVRGRKGEEEKGGKLQLNPQ